MLGTSLPEGLVARLSAEMDFDPVAAEPIDPGVVHNNRLLRLRGADGRELMAKLYYRDDRRRLEREFGAFRFLRARGFPWVPTAHVADEPGYWAVYSFEPGRTKAASELTLDELAAVGRLAAELHAVRPGETGADFPPAFGSRSLAERATTLRSRLGALLRAADEPDAFPELRAVAADGLGSAVDRLIDGAVAGLGERELARPVADRWRRLNSGDFAPHNLLVRSDGSVCALDFEFVGWDDPAALPINFLVADQSADLTDLQGDAFLRAYWATVDLPDSAFAGFDRLRALAEIGWLLINVSLLTSTHVARKRFAGDFDLAAHRSERHANVRTRLARARAAVDRLLT